MTGKALEIRPQPGPQEQFLSTSADIAIYGGAAGGGKSWALLMEPLRHIHNGKFGGVIFRRTTKQIRNEGGLWDESMGIYPLTGADPKQSILEHHWPTGAKMTFAHLEHEKNVMDWQGSQIPFIGFDELTHFTKKQFLYMLSRNRSMCGVRPYVRGTCNPDPDSFVAELIDWWIGEDGYPIPERAGVVRWFVNRSDKLYWADTPDELIEQFGGESYPKSFTFIPAKLSDNKLLMEADPGYLANLHALPKEEQMRLLGGNWKYRADGGIIKRGWWKYYKELPVVEKWSWSWDTAIEEGKENDYSVGQLWAKCEKGYYLVKMWRDKVGFPELLRMVKALYNADPASEVLIERKASGHQLCQVLEGESIPVIGMRPGGNPETWPGQTMPSSKLGRVNLISPIVEAGKVYLPEDEPWLADFLDEFTNFNGQENNTLHDDIVDTTTQYIARQLTPVSSGVVIL